MKANHKIVASISVAILLAAIGMAAAIGIFFKLDASAAARGHTYDVLDHSNKLLNDLADAETGQRGYLLTGDEAYLDPYRAAIRSAAADLTELHRLTAIESARQRLRKLTPLLELKFAEIKNTIELRRNNDPAGAIAIVRLGHGKLMMDSIRADLGVLRQIEESALFSYEASSSSDRRTLLAVISVASLGSLLAALCFAFLIYRETRRLLLAEKVASQQLEEAARILRISEEKLAVTLHSVGDAVIATDLDGRVTLMNPCAERLTGWMLDQATGRPVEEILHIINEESRQPVPIPVTAVLKHGTTQRLASHTVLIARDGSESAVDDSCAPILGRDGVLIGAVMVFRDVGEANALHRAVLDSEGRANFALRTAHMGAWDVNLEDHTSRRTQEHDLIFGYDSHLPWSFEIFLDHVLPEERAEVDRQFHAALAAREDLSIHCHIRREDGELRLIWAAGELRRFGAGAVLHYVGVVQDVTARHEAEEALRRSEERFKAIFMTAPLGIAVIDSLSGQVREVNKQFADIAGRPVQEMMNIDWMRITHPDDVQADLDKMALLNAGKVNGFQMEKRYLQPDGTVVWIDMTVVKLNSSDTANRCHFCIIQDVTERRQREATRELHDQQLRDHQFYTRSLIESNVDAIITTDPNGIITDVNRQMEILTGCTRDELIGSHFKNYFTDQVRAEASIKLVLSERKITNYELTALARDGKETVVSYNATTFYDRERHLKGMFAAAREITELKRFESELQEKNLELEHATRMKSEFLANMSHELRTPLNAIIGFSEALRDGLVGDLSETQNDYIGDIFGSGQHLLALINDILDLSKVEAGMMSLELEPTDIRALLANSLSIVKEKAAARHIRLEIEASEDLGVAPLDLRKTKQIVYNLLSNAVKFSGTDGCVTLRARRVPRSTVSTLPGDWRVRHFPLADSEYKEFLEICVIDRGIGISEDDMAKLFVPFSQISSSLARKLEGTGLGLAMIKQIAELHGGSVGVASAVGKGSSFAAWLPLRVAGQVATVHS